MLFFSSRGQVYKEKVWRLPLAAPQARGKALINILPLEQGERITTIMPLPEDEATWAQFDVMFATTGGTVRRNKLSDFVDVRRSGIIAMKLEEGEAHCRRADLHRERRRAAHDGAGGQCIRFPVTDVRVFKGRTSMGVRGIALADGDKVISMAILRHVEATPDERVGLSQDAPRRAPARARRRRRARARPRRSPMRRRLSQERYVEMSRGRAVRADRVRERLRQAHLVLRIPHHRPRRQRHRRDGVNDRNGRLVAPSRSRTAIRSCW